MSPPARPRPSTYFSQSDVADSFYRIRMPAGLSEMFVLPPVETKYLSLTDEQQATFGARCSPQLCVLPMGWSWALHFCQRVVEAAMRLAGCSVADAVTDRGPSQILLESDASSAKHAEYVDNFSAVSLDPEAARSAVARTKAVLESHGIGCHELEGPDRIATSTGLEFDGPRGQIRVSRKRVWRLRLGIEFALRLKKITGKEIESIVGHYTWCTLVRCPGLAVPHACYSFLRSAGSVPTGPWPSVLCELRWMVAVLPLLISETWLPWSGQLYASDAAPSGYGVCVKRVEPRLAAHIGRVVEKWRFRAEDSVQARAHTMGVDVLVLNPVDMTRLPDQGPLLNENGEQLLEEVPLGLMAGGWQTVLMVQWQREENTLRTEGRACLMAARHALRSVDRLCCRHLLISDNLALVLAFGKGRATSSNIINTCRVLAAFSFFTGSHFSVRWVPSEANPADAPSRGNRRASASIFKKATDPRYVDYAVRAQANSALAADVDEIAVKLAFHSGFCSTRSTSCASSDVVPNSDDDRDPHCAADDHNRDPMDLPSDTPTSISRTAAEAEVPVTGTTCPGARSLSPRDERRHGEHPPGLFPPRAPLRALAHHPESRPRRPRINGPADLHLVRRAILRRPTQQRGFQVHCVDDAPVAKPEATAASPEPLGP